MISKRGSPFPQILTPANQETLPTTSKRRGLGGGAGPRDRELSRPPTRRVRGPHQPSGESDRRLRRFQAPSLRISLPKGAASRPQEVRHARIAPVHPSRVSGRMRTEVAGRSRCRCVKRGAMRRREVARCDATPCQATQCNDRCKPGSGGGSLSAAAGLHRPAPDQGYDHDCSRDPLAKTQRRNLMRNDTAPHGMT